MIGTRRGRSRRRRYLADECVRLTVLCGGCNRVLCVIFRSTRPDDSDNHRLTYSARLSSFTVDTRDGEEQPPHRIHPVCTRRRCRDRDGVVSMARIESVIAGSWAADRRHAEVSLTV